MISRSEKLRGIILKRSNFGEADKILTIFTQSKGKVKVIAKGIRKIKSRRAPHLELFNEVEIMLHHGKTFDIITEAKQIQSFTEPFARPGLAKLELSGYLFYISEVLDKILPEHVPHPEVYSSLLTCLNKIGGVILVSPKGASRISNDNKDGNSGQARMTEDKVKHFVVQLLWDLGYLPHGQYPKQGITSFVEEIIEKPIKSKKFLDEI